MSKHHPLDSVFRDQLRDQAVEAPLHLWEQIDQKRNFKHRFFNQVRLKKPLAALLASMALAGSSLLLYNMKQPEIKSFPIPASGVVAYAQLSSPGSDAASTQNTTASLSAAATAAVSSSPSATPTASTRTPAAPAAATTASGSGGNVQPPVRTAYLSMGANESAQTAALQLSASSTAQPAAEQASAVIEMETPTATVRPRYEEELPVLAYRTDSEPGDLLTGLFDPSPKCATFGNGFWAFYADFMLSPDLAFNTLQAREAGFEDYAKQRRETESRLFAFSGGVRLSMIADNGLALRTGINYSQVNEKFRFYDGRSERTVTEAVFDSDNNVIGYDTFTVVGERYKVSNNIYRMVDIPFILGYEFRAGNLGLAVNAGAYLNLLFRQDGDFLSPETLEPVPIDSGDPESYPAFKRQTGLGYYGSLGLTYETPSGLQLLLEPHFKIFPKSVTQDEYALKQRYMSAGLFMGIRKRL